MHISRTVSVLLAALLLTVLRPGTAMAGEPVSLDMPPGFVMQISTPSLSELIDDADRVSSRLASAARIMVPVEFRKEAETNLPFLVRQRETPLRASMYMANTSLLEPRRWPLVLALENLPFDELAEDLATQGTRLEDGSRERYSHAGDKDEPDLIVYRDPSGLLVVSFSWDIMNLFVKALDEGWTPHHRVDGSLELRVTRPSSWLLPPHWLLQSLGSELMEARERNKGARAFLTLCRTAVEEARFFLEEEMTAIEWLEFDLSLKEEPLLAALRLYAPEDTLVGTMAKSASERDNVAIPAVAMPADMMRLSVTAAPEVILPGFGTMVATWLDGFLEEYLSRHHTPLLDAWNGVASTDSGVEIAGEELRSEGVFRYVWRETDEADALLEALTDLSRRAAGVLTELLPDYVQDEILTVEDVRSEGPPQRRFVWDEGFFNTFRRVAIRSCLLGRITAYAAHDGGLAQTSGPAYAPAMSAFLSGALTAQPAFESAETKRILDLLKNRQNHVSLVNHNALILYWAAREARDRELTLDMEALHAALSRSEPAATTGGFAWGGRDGGLSFEAAAPLELLESVCRTISRLEYASDIFTKDFSGGGNQEENAAQAVDALKMYFIGQITFQTMGLGGDGVNSSAGAKGFADNFRNLHYGVARGESPAENYTPINLIGKKFADAFAGPTAGMETVGTRQPKPDAPVPYHGYVFLEPPGVDFSKEFGLVAYPVSFGETGRRILYIGYEGTIWEMLVHKREGDVPEPGTLPRLLSADERPSANISLWVEY